MDAKAVGQRIKAAREKKNMTQEDLAALIDISPTHISVIERGTKIARMDTFVAIANVLEVSADALLVDVVEHSALGVASELSAAIADLPHEERMRNGQPEAQRLGHERRRFAGNGYKCQRHGRRILPF